MDLDESARNILRANDRGGYTVPTSGLYPYQWNWDSVFAAWGFAAFDIDRAWVELETLFRGQWDDGMVPHIVFHKDDPGYFPGPDVWQTGQQPPTSGISQPPIAATFARLIYEEDPVAGRLRIESLYPKLLAFHRWFHTWRSDGGVIFTVHPWETGRDNSPDWDLAMANIDTSGVGEYTRRDTSHVDAAMRPKKEDYDRYLAILYAARDHDWDTAWIRDHAPLRVADPGLMFMLLRADRDLLALAGVLDAPTDEIEGWIAETEKALPRIWNSDIGCYDARDLLTGRFSGGVSSSSFLCWYAGVGGDEMLGRLKAVRSRSRFGVPSFDPASPKYDGLRYWRGPTWGVVNCLVAMGLAEAGHNELADAIRQETAELIRKGGFHEYFDPITGAPAGGDAFTWTAAIWLRWANR